MVNDYMAVDCYSQLCEALNALIDAGYSNEEINTAFEWVKSDIEWEEKRLRKQAPKELDD